MDTTIKIQTGKNSIEQLFLQQSKVLKIFSLNSYKWFKNYDTYGDLKFEH